MDEIQSFISRNKHQLGYIMGEASRQWIKNDPKGALTVGPCNLFIERYGDYHKLQDENKELKNDLNTMNVNNPQFRDIWNRLNEKEAELSKLKKELIQAYKDRSNMLWAGEKEWIDNRIKELETK